MLNLKHVLSSSKLLVVLLLLVKHISTLTLEEELTLSYDQKVKLDKFKQLVSSRLPHDYMKQDLQLVRWLRATRFDIPAAERMIIENVHWREQNNIDNILNEDWSDFDNEYRITMEGCDALGRPVISTVIGDWDMRKAVVTGNKDRMMRYTDKLLEEGNVLLRHLQESGQNVTQFVELFDMANFNLRTHGCPQCLAIYSYNFQSYEKHYPGSIHKAISVNTPAYFNAVFSILRPLLSKETLNIVQIYGRDKSEWQNVLRNEIGAENLSRHYGGVKGEVWDVEDVRRDHSRYVCGVGNASKGLQTVVKGQDGGSSGVKE